MGRRCGTPFEAFGSSAVCTDEVKASRDCSFSPFPLSFRNFELCPDMSNVSAGHSFSYPYVDVARRSSEPEPAGGSQTRPIPCQGELFLFRFLRRMMLIDSIVQARNVTRTAAVSTVNGARRAWHAFDDWANEVCRLYTRLYPLLRFV